MCGMARRDQTALDSVSRLPPDGRPNVQTHSRQRSLVGRLSILCRKCSKQTHGRRCENCETERQTGTFQPRTNSPSLPASRRGRPRKLNTARRKDYRYEGLLFHDLRRTAARNLRRRRNGESVVMKIGGWKTASVFRRYDIVDPSDLADAAASLIESPSNSVKTDDDQRGSNGHVSVHGDPLTRDPSKPAHSEAGNLTFVASAN